MPTSQEDEAGGSLQSYLKLYKSKFKASPGATGDPVSKRQQKNLSINKEVLGLYIKFCQESSLCAYPNYRFALEKIDHKLLFLSEKEICLHKYIAICLIKDSYKKSEVLGHIVDLIVKTRKRALLFSVGFSMKKAPGKRCEGK